MAFVVVIRDAGDNAAAHLEGIDRTLMFVDDFAARANQHGIGDRGVPTRIKGGEKRIDVLRAKNKIASGGMQLR